MTNKFGKKREKSASGSSEGGETQAEREQDIPYPRKRVRWNVTSESLEESRQDQSDSDAVELDKTCMAIFCQHGRLGCAYYDYLKRAICVLEDSKEDGHCDLTKMLVEQVKPTVILASSKSDETGITLLQDYADASGCIVQIRPHREFVASKGRDRLLSLRLLAEFSGEVDNTSDISSEASKANGLWSAYDFMRKRTRETGDPNMKRWNAAIRLANFATLDSAPLCLSSIGALIDFLARERAANDLDEGGPETLDIQGIEILTLDDVMHINADALCSLQVFQSETHASIHSDKAKEGLSLFGILSTTRTVLGRSLLRTWLLRPSLSLKVVESRHDAIECFLRPENSPAITALQTHLKGMINVPRTLALLKSGKGSTRDWQAIVKFTYHSLMLHDALSGLYQCSDIEIVQKLVGVLDINRLREIGNTINETIDWEESAEVHRVCIRSHIDRDLDNRKHVYRGIDAVLSKVAKQISLSIPPDYTTSLNVVYFPQLGFLVAVPMLEEWKSQVDVQAHDGWSFQFSTDSHVYFKSKEMHDMDLHIGDLHPTIVDREIELVQELLEKIIPFHDFMMSVCGVCAELDCLLSFAEAAKTFNYRRPRMVEGSVIDIVQGRHPLQELAVDAFVPNDSHLIGGVGFGQSHERHPIVNGSDVFDGSSNSIILCTGANACGKSVYLKQVALIQYMAQVMVTLEEQTLANSVSFVPAESATLGIVDKIFTRIQTRESVSKVQSAFMIDLNQVSLALRNCTSRSLILLDEFGKGTISTDGAGLFCGVLRHLLNRGPDCPKVLAATHFHEVLRPEFLDPESFPITFLHMQVLFTSPDGNLGAANCTTPGIDVDHDESRNPTRTPVPGERITYLYRIAPGLSYTSNAAQCAAMFGLPNRIVERATYVSKLLATHELDKLLEEQMTEEERHDLQAAEQVARRFLEWDLTSEEAAHQGGVKRRLAQVLGRDRSVSGA